MKIVFLPSGSIPIQADTLKERPLGGIETAVIRLAEALEQIGEKAIVLTPVENPKLSKPLYVPFRALQDIGPVDALIVVREWKPLFLPIQAKKRFLWTGDSYDQPQNIGIGDKRILKQFDALLLVSEWHRQEICRRAGIPPEKASVLRNGVDLSLFEGSETRIPKRLIYSSTPYRGLIHLPRLFRRIREKHPDAELHVFSGTDVYRGTGGDAYLDAMEREHRALFDDLRSISGCTIRGNVKQAELAREFKRASILAYPNIFEETSCITVMEAQAGGCVPVTSARAALPETVGNAGVLIEGEPGTAAYDDRFVAEVDRLFNDRGAWEALSHLALKQAVETAWSQRAARFVEQIKENL